MIRSRRFLLCLVFAAAIGVALTGNSQSQENPRPAGTMTGIWQGEYRYPNDAMPPVKFRMVVIQEGDKVAGFGKEPNTFGREGEPLLHSVIKGSVDKNGKLTLVKTYDGSAGQSHDVDYRGESSQDGKKFQGTWNIKDFQGSFTIEKMPFNDRTLDELK